ncbi:MAG: zinc-dependent metalloprotease [Acidimicrobiia bacterium]
MRADLVDVNLAKRVAARVASTGQLEGSYLLHGIDDQLSVLVGEAAPLVDEETGFSPPGKASAVVMSRADWAAANIDSIVGLMDPLFRRVSERMSERGGSGLVVRAYRPALAVQLAGVMGFIAQRVLGQYDLMAGRGEVWFVGPNLVVMERRFGFVPRDFRMWVALHELTHRAQFEGNSWMAEHFLSSVKDLMEAIPLDVGSLVERLTESVRGRPHGNEGQLALLGPRERKMFEDLQAFMSLIEGHANFVMDRVAVDLIPTQPRMRRTMRARSAMEGPLAKFLRRILGLDLKRMQYEEGQNFVDHIMKVGGKASVTACFSSKESLPTIEEIREPDRWLARTGASSA